jgi:acetylornithine deacetylase/succinyl-diaminopimelate desuccinylase-like protein
MLAGWLAAVALAAPAPSAAEAQGFAVSLAHAGPRPAGSAAERRAHARVEQRFGQAGLRIGHEPFRVPGRGASRDVIGVRDSKAHCLTIAMAHTDSVPPAPGADDNGSGVGTLVALARALGAGPVPACDVWLVATGAEERPYTGQPDHLGASALVRRLRKMGRLDDVRLALSLDEVGRGTTFDLHSTAAAPRAEVEGRILKAAGRAHVGVRWVGDPAGAGNSDHRELALAGAPAAKLGVPDEPCRHTACDTAARLERRAFARVLRVVWPLLRQK